MAIEQNPNVKSTTSGKGNFTSSSAQQAREENFEGQNQTSETRGNDIASDVGNVLRGDTSAVKDIYNKATESGGELAGQAIGQVKEKAASVIDKQKTNVASGLGSIANEIRRVGENLRGTNEENSFVDLTAQYSDTLAQRIEGFSDYLERKNLNELYQDAQSLARRNPTTFVISAFALGFLAARFLKSSNPNQALMIRPQGGRSRTPNYSKYDPQEGRYTATEGIRPDLGTASEIDKTSSIY